jgi:DUF1680 family protein
MNALSPSPVDSRRSPYARLSTLGYNSVRFDHGFWTRRQALNREVGLEHGSRMLEQSGAFENFRLAAGNAGGDYRLPEWRDQDVYKWLESAAYEVANDPSGALQREAGRAIDAVVAAQDDDGYLHTYHQVVAPAQRWADHGRNHEMFCAGQRLWH